MTDWTPCPILVGEPDYWDADACNRRRRLSGVAQAIEDLRAVATRFERDPDDTLAAWEAYARASGDDGMATFNGFVRDWELQRSFALVSRLDAFSGLGWRTYSDPVPRGQIRRVTVDSPTLGLSDVEMVQRILDDCGIATDLSNATLQLATAALSEPDSKAPRVCYRCAQSHGSKPCRQTMRGRR